MNPNVNPKGSLSFDLQEYLDLLGYDSPAILPAEPSSNQEGRSLVVPPAAASPLEELSQEAASCQKCDLCKSRQSVVFGEGNPQADLLFVGEAPGQHEDEQGRPFVGPAGELLGKMIVAMGYTREQVYLTNLIKCRPPENRNPEPSELKECSYYLNRQIELMAPRAIVCLGTLAAQIVLGNDLPISRLRGKTWHIKMGGHEIEVFPTFHPAFLLRNPERKKDVWEDLQKVMAYLNL